MSGRRQAPNHILAEGMGMLSMTLSLQGLYECQSGWKSALNAQTRASFTAVLPRDWRGRLTCRNGANVAGCKWNSFTLGRRHRLGSATPTPPDRSGIDSSTTLTTPIALPR